MELTFDSFISQVAVIGTVVEANRDKYNEGQFTAKLEDNTLVRVTGGSNLFGSAERLEGTRFRWEIKVPTVCFQKMADESFVQEPCMARFQGWTLQEAINEEKA